MTADGEAAGAWSLGHQAGLARLRQRRLDKLNRLLPTRELVEIGREVTRQGGAEDRPFRISVA